MTEIDPEVVAFYEQGLEVDRLSAQHPFEFVRTIDILERVLPAAPVDVLDVGGGPGRYSAWLCERGDRVELIDPIPLHVEQALALDVAGLRARLGDSRELSVEDGSVDVVLLMGPLYHLIDPADRRQSLRECLRVLRPGGRVVATAITRWAPLFDLVIREAGDAARIGGYWDRVSATGFQRGEDAEGFTTAYFHRPADLLGEVSAAGFANVRLFGVEGITMLLTDHLERVADPGRRELLTLAAAAIENEPELAGISPHILAVAEKPQPS